MQQFSLDRSDLAQAVVIFLVTCIAAAMLGLVLAYWAWVWFAPPIEPSAPAAMDFPNRIDSARALFGPVPSERAPAIATGAAVKLFGVVASPRVRQGYAVMQLEGREILVVPEGGDLFPGVRLAEVHPDHVVLERGGLRELLAWPEKSAIAPQRASRQ